MAGEPNGRKERPHTIREIGLGELERGRALWAEFEALHHAWTARGVTRWLGWLTPPGPHPVIVWGAFGPDGVLDAALVGLWSPRPIDHFDALFDVAPDAPQLAETRPAGGVWHFIAVTSRPGIAHAHAGLGRALVSHALAWARAAGHDEARTLSPVVGLPALLALWQLYRPTDQLADIVLRAAHEDGRPWLQILRLHLGGGARLEQLMGASRADDWASAGVNLRFLYATDVAARSAQRERWKSWCDMRAAAFASVLAHRLGDLEGESVWVAPCLPDDLEILAGPLRDQALSTRSERADGTGA